jgi:hypothetical protein
MGSVVIPIGEERNQYRIFVWKPSSQNPLRRRKDGVRIDASEIMCD